MTKGTLVVFTGPSGSGKGTILKECLQDPSLYLSISNTTRSPRPGEVDGVHYHFITHEDFEKKIQEGGMLEYANYCGNSYGTPRDRVWEQLEAGRDVVLEIEVQGAMQVRKNCPEAVLVFVVPPTPQVLRQRLIGRGTEDMETVEKRLARSLEEIGMLSQFDYLVVNDQLEDAVETFRGILSACRAGDPARLAQLKSQSDSLKNTITKEFSL